MSKTFEDATERVKAAGEGGPRWIPVAAAALAVLAAVSGYLANVRATHALIAKNDSIVATTRASDTYNEYQAERLKYVVVETALEAGTGPSSDVAKLRATADREAKKGPPLLKIAQSFDRRAEELDQKSEHLMDQHETIEIGSTLFEVSIVLVSITALVGSRLLPIAAGAAATLGLLSFIVGLLR
jgi:hypothetical protein